MTQDACPKPEAQSHVLRCVIRAAAASVRALPAGYGI
jgi:hypothetical protein